jgi:hypothetical protein
MPTSSPKGVRRKDPDKGINPTDRTAHEPKATLPLFAELRLVKALAKSGTQANPKHRRWTAIWLAPKGSSDNDTYFFSVTLAGKSASRICSEGFNIKEVMSRPPEPLKAGPCPP